MMKNERISEEIIRHVAAKICNGDDARAELGRLEHEEPGLSGVLQRSEKDIQNFLTFTNAPEEIQECVEERIEVVLARILASIRLGHTREWEAQFRLNPQDN